MTENCEDTKFASILNVLTGSNQNAFVSSELSLGFFTFGTLEQNIEKAGTSTNGCQDLFYNISVRHPMFPVRQ